MSDQQYITRHIQQANFLSVYADSSPDIYDDPKVETIVELLKRVWGSAWGAVTTAFIADATPTALTAHTRSRSAYGPLIDQALNSVTNYTWTNHGGPDVYCELDSIQDIALSLFALERARR